MHVQDRVSSHWTMPDGRFSMGDFRRAAPRLRSAHVHKTAPPACTSRADCLMRKTQKKKHMLAAWFANPTEAKSSPGEIELAAGLEQGVVWCGASDTAHVPLRLAPTKVFAP